MPITGIKLPIMGTLAISQSTRAARRKTAEANGLPTSLADAPFTTTRQRVLSLLFGQPSRSFFASELIKLTGSGSGAVQRELKRLVSSGLVGLTRIGKQKHYQGTPTRRSSRNSAAGWSSPSPWPNRSAVPWSRSATGLYWPWFTDRWQSVPAGRPVPSIFLLWRTR